MRRLLVIALTATALTGCGKKKDDGGGAAAGNPSAGGAGSTPMPGGGGAAAGGAKITCDEVIPAAARDKYFAGLTFAEEPGYQSNAVECKFEKADDPMKNVSISVTCDKNLVMPETIAAVKERRMEGTTDLAGLGRAAMKSDMQVTFWDDDSPCFAIITSLGDADKLAIAKEVSATLTEAAAK